MTPSIPPLLRGPRMAVWAYFPFDNRVIDATGQQADWAWAMRQWDTVAAAGSTVRLVVADQPYSLIDAGTQAGRALIDDLDARIAACRGRGQLVYGRVYSGGGRLELGLTGQRLDDPLRPGRLVPSVAEQIDAWRRSLGDRIDGIYVDSGPTVCTDPQRPNSLPGIPPHYRDYRDRLVQLGYSMFVQAAQYPDPEGWLRNLGADVVELWEAGVARYLTKYGAVDACRPGQDAGVPDWWQSDQPFEAWSRVHVINDCLDVETMRTVATTAIQRGASTVWITCPRRDEALGPQFDVLPDYWVEQVEFFAGYARAEEQAEKDARDDAAQAAKDAADAAAQEEKDRTDAQAEKDIKDNKDEPDAVKDAKDAKDDKDDPDKGKEDPKSDQKEKPEDKEDKENKDGKDFKDTDDHKMIYGENYLKDSEMMAKSMEGAGNAMPDPFPDGDPAQADPAEPPEGRTFIRPDERPSVGDSIVAEPPEQER